MAVTLSVSKNNILGGIPFQESRQVAADAQIVHSVNVPAADVGELTTRTSNTEGIITADESDHGISTGDRVDLYWDGGSRRAVDVGTVSGALIPFDGGVGDNLPLASAEIFVAKPVELSMVADGNKIRAILTGSAKRGTIVFEDDTEIELLFQPIGAGVSDVWHDLDGTENPLSGETISKVFVSQASNSVANMKVGILHNN